jgi:hypothetical protein
MLLVKTTSPFSSGGWIKTSVHSGKAHWFPLAAYSHLATLAGTANRLATIRLPPSIADHGTDEVRHKAQVRFVRSAKAVGELVARYGFGLNRRRPDWGAAGA